MNTENTSNSKSDIREEGGLMPYVSDTYRPYALLARMDRPIGIWLLLLPSVWALLLSAGTLGVSLGVYVHLFYMLVMFGLGAVAMRSAGCVINDIWDRDLDRRVERTRGRPLAAADISLKQAFVFLMILLLIGLVVLSQMNGTTIILGIVSLPLIIAYPLMKRITWWPQAFLGLTFNFGVLMGWSAMVGRLDMPALLIYVGAIFWTLGYDTIYAHQDKEDDMMAGIKSTALRFGSRGKIWVGGFYVLAVMFFALGLGVIDPLYVFGVLPIGGHFAYQMRTWRMDDAGSALSVFKANRDAGFLMAAACFVILVMVSLREFFV
ncbi:MAG: 4-hydroxybenzoate octaprenyltransferase [Alphaproteobacteria bacterium]